DSLRLHVLSGQVQGNADAARLYGVTERRIKEWRNKYPAFDREFRVALADALATLTNEAMERAMEGSDTMLRFFLERRGGEAWQMRQHIDHTSNGNTMAALIAEHGELDEEEARERGLIYDADEYSDED
ncbi:MAG: hypothetical protein P8Y47_08355, partial [Alphaproteobacteria bacterium]